MLSKLDREVLKTLSEIQARDFWTSGKAGLQFYTQIKTVTQQWKDLPEWRSCPVNVDFIEDVGHWFGTHILVHMGSYY